MGVVKEDNLSLVGDTLELRPQRTDKGLIIAKRQSKRQLEHHPVHQGNITGDDRVRKDVGNAVADMK